MITPMTRVEIVCLTSIRSDVVKAIQVRGRLHLEESSTELEDAPDFLGRVQLQGEAYDEFARLEDWERALGEVAPLLTSKPDSASLMEVSKKAKHWPEDSWSEKIDGWVSRLRTEVGKKTTIQDSIIVLENYQRILVDVTPALGGNEVTLGKGTRAIVLTGKVDKAVSRLEARFREALGDDWKFHRKSAKKRLVGLLTFPEDQENAVTQILSQEGVTPVDMREDGYEGATVGEVLKRIEKTLTEQRAALAQIQKALEVFSVEEGANLICMKAMVTDKVEQFRAQGRCAESKMVTVVHGWIPSNFFSDLEKALERDFSGQVVVSDVGHEGIELTHIPTLLKNRPFFQPFEVVLSLFRPPTYGTLDPTVLVALSFIFFYGFILGDVAYGAVILGISVWAARKFGHIHPAIMSATTIGKYMGYSGIVFGVIFGEYLGNFGERLCENFGVPFFYIFHRAHEKEQLLVYAILVGVVHIPLAMILGIREDFRHGHTNHAIEKLGLFMGLLALMIVSCAYFDVWLFATPPFTYLAVGLFGVGVVLIFKAMGLMGLVGIMEILSLGSNVLSYARLMALGVAAIAIADIANDLPSTVGPLIGIPAALLIHMLNIGLSMASPTIHSLRLNFVEFLPKFYNPAGSNFNPFRKEAQW